MGRKEFIQFGKKTDNKFKIIERKYKDNNVYFYVEITNTFDLQSFDMQFPETYIFGKTFKSYDDALDCVKNLKEQDKKITVLEEKIHII
jgi:hypothetical protein